MLRVLKCEIADLISGTTSPSVILKWMINSERLTTIIKPALFCAYVERYADSRTISSNGNSSQRPGSTD